MSGHLKLIDGDAFDAKVAELERKQGLALVRTALKLLIDYNTALDEASQLATELEALRITLVGLGRSGDELAGLAAVVLDHLRRRTAPPMIDHEAVAALSAEWLRFARTCGAGEA
jgi:hypothetical protein